MEKIRISKALLDMKAKTYNQAISELIEASSVPNKAEAMKAVLKREEKSSTYVGDGIAVPHAKSPSINKGEAIIGRSASGIEWGNGICNIVILMLFSMDDSGSHVIFLSEIMKAVSSQIARTEILNAKSESEILEVFKGL